MAGNFPGAGQSPNTRLQQVQNATVLNSMRSGKLNPGPDLTLTASVTSTDMVDPRLSSASIVLLDPVTASAAATLAAGNIYALTADRVKGTFTWTHNSDAATDRTFRTVILG